MHQPEEAQHYPQVGRELLVLTSFTPELVGEAMRILSGIYRRGYRYIKAGVLCLGLAPDTEKQCNLFRAVDPEAEEKPRRLMAAVDKLNLWGGRGTVRPAAMGFSQKWQMRQNRKSPCYTTRLGEVPRASL